jgi:plastocyanin domain-containing protein
MTRPSILLTLGSILATLVASGCRKSQDAPPVPPAPAAEPVKAPPAPAAKPAGVQDKVDVVVNEEGFVPAKIPAKAGKPITLAITRKVERTCATEILFQGQEGKTDLPLNKTVEVTYTPKSSGNINFGCAMGMMIGGVLEVAD